MINWFVLCIAACTCCYAQAGVVVEGTRFIFNADKPSITFTVNNTSQQRFLLLSKVLDAQGQATRDVPFMTTPPLFPLAAGTAILFELYVPAETCRTIAKVCSGSVWPAFRKHRVSLRQIHFRWRFVVV